MPSGVRYLIYHIISYILIIISGGILVLAAPRGPDPGVLEFYPGSIGTVLWETSGHVPGVGPRGNGVGPRGPSRTPGSPGLYFAIIHV